CRVPQDGHCHVRVFSESSASRCPHELHVLELVYQRSITITCRPALAALYSTMARKVPHPQSEIALASDRLRTMFLTARLCGLGIFSPSLVTAKSLIPRSTPTAWPAVGSCSGSATSTSKETDQRPHGSRETVTVDGPIPAGSMSGHDHTNPRGVSILARNNCPSRYRNPERVYSADCRPVRDLYRGYRARLAKKLA